LISLLELWKRLKGKAVSSTRKRGLIGTVRHLPTFVAASIKVDPNKRFDRCFHVDTADVLLGPPELQSDQRFVHSNWYGPTATKTFSRILREFHLDFREFVFVDFGCGKGKALLLASRLPFRQIIGIELWPELFEVALKNLKSYTGKRQCKTFRLLQMDASEFPFPREPGIYYFYDPFREEVLRKVLDNMRRSLAEVPRESYVVYTELERPDILDQADFLTLLKRTPHYSIYKVSGSTGATRNNS